MTQHRHRSPAAAEPSYAGLLGAIAADLDPIVTEVAADVARPADDPARVRAAVGPVVRRLVSDLLAAPGRPRQEVARLRDEGAAAALAGEPVAAPIDRYLSAGWVLWEAASRHPDADPAALAALGSALLRTGDMAAAALAGGHGAAERDVAGRTAATRRAFVDDLLDLPPGDADALARLGRRAGALGIAPTTRCRPVVAWLGRELDEVSAEVERAMQPAERPRGPSRVVAGGGSREGPAPAEHPVDTLVGTLVGTRRGRLVAVVVGDRPERERLERGLASLAGERRWVGIRGPSVTGVGSLAAVVADTLAALVIAEAVVPRGLLDVTALALERALLADRWRLGSAVDHELGALLAAPRNGPVLVATLRTWLETGQSIRGAARALGVAPRTVAYRLERIEALLGRRLAGPVVLRLAAALLAAELISGQTVGSAGVGGWPTSDRAVR